MRRYLYFYLPLMLLAFGAGMVGEAIAQAAEPAPGSLWEMVLGVALRDGVTWQVVAVVAVCAIVREARRTALDLPSKMLPVVDRIETAVARVIREYDPPTIKLRLDDRRDEDEK